MATRAPRFEFPIPGVTGLLEGAPASRREERASSRGYTPSAKPRIVAAGAAVLITTLIVMPLAFINAAHHASRHDSLKVYDLKELRMPPPQPRTRPTRVVARTLSVEPKPLSPTPLPVVAPSIVMVPAAPVLAAAPVAGATPSHEAASVPRAAAGDNLAASVIDAPLPDYPEECRRAHEQGTVILYVTLNTDGRVEDVVVRQASGSFRLDRAALKAVRRWRWSPTMVGGEAVKVAGLVRIPFVLRS